jgi:hypothetical protein
LGIHSKISLNAPDHHGKITLTAVWLMEILRRVPTTFAGAGRTPSAACFQAEHPQGEKIFYLDFEEPLIPNKSYGFLLN